MRNQSLKEKNIMMNQQIPDEAKAPAFKGFTQQIEDAAETRRNNSITRLEKEIASGVNWLSGRGWKGNWEIYNYPVVRPPGN